MKLHYLLLITIHLSLFCTPSVSAQNKPCNNFTCAYLKAETFLKQAAYQKALDNLDSAEGYLTDSNTKEKEQIKQLRRRLFVAIEKEKEDAKRARDEAKRQTEIAKNALVQVEIEKQTAVAAEKKAKAVLDKIYFYDDKFGLASQSKFGYPWYGFIDRELNTKIDFKYSEALPFEDIGYAKVSIYSNSNALFIDTLGHEYKLTTDLNQLDSNITALDLRDKYLENIPPAVFRHKQLKILLLNYDNLKTLNAGIENLSQLIYLNLSHNQLTTLPSELAKLTNLQSLNLSSNQLTQFPTELYKLTNLQSLDFSSNQLTEFPTELYKLTNLQSLDLGGNSFTGIPIEGLSKLKKLHSLSLYNDSLKRLPDDIVQLTNLRFLNLHRNQLKSLPTDFNKLTNLQELILGENELTNLEGIEGLKNLQSLDVQSNKIATLPEEIKNLIHLTELKLGSNPMSEEEQTRIKKLLPNCRVSFISDFDELAKLFLMPEDIKDTLEIMNNLISLITNLQKQYFTDTTLLPVKAEIALQYNELSWYLLQKGKFPEAELCIRKGLNFDATNVFLPTNLPTSLLLQGKYQEAENEYRTWKNKPFNQFNLPFYKDIFLEDLKTLEKIGIIPKERQENVEKIRQLLTKN